MKLNFLNKFFSSIKQKDKTENEDVTEIKDVAENLEDNGFTQEELLEYDKHVHLYYTYMINSLILYTYNVDQLDEMAPILIDPLAELYEELDYAFIPVLFNTIFRNKLIDESFKEDLLNFKKKVDDIPVEIWDWDFLDHHETWKNIRLEAEMLLNKLNIETRIYNTDYTTILFKK
ncbi:hypothetical protein WH221_17465 [Chryseobacterium culicis]|uniref:Uncharacterized protein n=1 Tax=Chryseobacterium culicis TaxID=680127 RepID=A0A2S9CPQ3_CHRCI|nr:hypothetical protein [Chryseobacterium culicis]PRB82473.1 hypothetical protein CQ022_17410 [Chryseobacterium culicis]PRB88848.1 hypothetical protein CQ033_16305 [Chryseobacterium culicis]